MGLIQEGRKIRKIKQVILAAGAITGLSALPFIDGCGNNTDSQIMSQPTAWSVPESTPTSEVTPYKPPTPEPELIMEMTESMKALFSNEKFVLWKENLPRGTLLTIKDYGEKTPRRGVVTASRGLNERTEPESSRDETVEKVHPFETLLSWQLEVKVEKKGKPAENWAAIEKDAWIALREGEESFVKQYPLPKKPAVFMISNESGK